MISTLLTKIIGSRNDRTLKALRKIVKQINAMEPQFEALSDQELQAKTAEYRQRLEQGETLEQLLPEAFATVREASRRVFGMRHFDVQLIGGMVLNSNRIAEMKTGEGKTLTATLPAYLNALTGRGVHVVTVNDYLAKRDAEANRPLFAFLGMTVDCNVPGMDASQKRDAYAADITYGTNNEFGFDYLRDNMAFSPEQRVQRPLNYALVDEVDSVLIDEARTPLIISGPAEDSSAMYTQINKLIPLLVKQDKEDSEEYTGDGHYTVDEKNRQALLTENGQIFVEELLKKEGLLAEEDSLFSATNISLLHHVNAGLRAHTLFERNVDYIVQKDEIVIVDEHTGRTMPGRRWSDGLHQAVEAKEGVKIQNENQTLASITFQNYFRLYDKLAGMTGTADTEAFEFQQIYGLDTVVIPTNKPMVRKDMGDLVYLTAQEKYAAIVQDIRECVKRGQPVLVGTVSIENSELLSGILTKENIPHKVLNAKFHAMEAEIVAQAGQTGAVTIATNMAGRGTDIVLGGNWQAEIAQLENPSSEQIAELKAAWQVRHDEVLAAGGLHIIGTERHESRRIDNQLRGRSGRQGDPGSSRFYLSMEDTLMRIFASDRVTGMMKKLGMEEGEAIEHPWVTKAIENAQRKVEGRNFDIRKNLLEFDDVADVLAWAEALHGAARVRGRRAGVGLTPWGVLVNTGGDFVAHGLVGALVGGRQQLVLQAAQVLDLAHGIDEAPEFLDGQVLVRGAECLVFQFGRNVGLEAGLADRGLDHAPPAVGHHRALERGVGLQADDDVVVGADVSGGEGVHVAGDVGLDVVDAALALDAQELALQRLPDVQRLLGRAREEARVAGVRGEVGEDEVAHVDDVLPGAALEPLPSVRAFDVRGRGRHRNS